MAHRKGPKCIQSRAFNPLKCVPFALHRKMFHVKHLPRNGSSGIIMTECQISPCCRMLRCPLRPMMT
jgi:hypothetical protein